VHSTQGTSRIEHTGRYPQLNEHVCQLHLQCTSDLIRDSPSIVAWNQACFRIHAFPYRTHLRKETKINKERKIVSLIPHAQSQRFGGSPGSFDNSLKKWGKLLPLRTFSSPSWGSSDCPYREGEDGLSAYLNPNSGLRAPIPKEGVQTVRQCCCCKGLPKGGPLTPRTTLGDVLLLLAPPARGRSLQP
jgi:hypothetical protein